MKFLNPYSNLGDTLSAIKFNFNCLDVHTCNLNYGATNKFNRVAIEDSWGETVSETFFMSGNWDSYATHVHNASAYWDRRIHTIVYPFPFPEGTMSVDSIKVWLTSTFPPQNYRPDEFFIVHFFGFYKDPALHRPSSTSLAKFGLITEVNNVYLKDLKSVTFFQEEDKWISAGVDNLHINQPCLETFCGTCYGPKYILENPVCVPETIYYELCCTFVPTVTSAAPDPCLDENYTILWDLEPDNGYLINDIRFQYLSASNIMPYSVLPSKNPVMDVVASDVWTKYIRDTAKPVRLNAKVDRYFVKDLLYRYRFDTSCECFVPSGIYLKDTGLWDLSSSVTASFGFKNSDLITLLNKSGKSNIVDGACPFDLYIDTEWYRWVTNNTFSISAYPYWHIGVEPGSAVLGFDYQPIPSVSDPASAWAIALGVLGENALSAYFGTELDLMGHVLSVVLLPTTETYPLSTDWI